jgi:hypothetical protein
MHRPYGRRDEGNQSSNNLVSIAAGLTVDGLRSWAARVRDGARDRSEGRAVAPAVDDRASG